MHLRFVWMARTFLCRAVRLLTLCAAVCAVHDPAPILHDPQHQIVEHGDARRRRRTHADRHRGTPDAQCTSEARRSVGQFPQSCHLRLLQSCRAYSIAWQFTVLLSFVAFLAMYSGTPIIVNLGGPYASDLWKYQNKRISCAVSAHTISCHIIITLL